MRLRTDHLRRAMALGLAALVGATLGVVVAPFVPFHSMNQGHPVSVVSRDVHVVLDGEQIVALPIAASHVAVHWAGAPDAAVTVAFSTDGTTFGAAEPVDPDEMGDQAGSSETYGRVMVAQGARYVRLTSDRPMSDLTVVAMDGGDEPAAMPDTANVVSAASSQPTIISRAAWGADESLRFDDQGLEPWPEVFQRVQKIVIHHTAGPNYDPNPAATMRSIMRYDAITKGWTDIGYNFLIDSGGHIYEGRHSRTYAPGEMPTGEDAAGLLATGAHALEFNSGVIGIAMMGTFTNQDITTAARASLEKLIAWESERHDIDPKGAATYVNPVTGAVRVFPNIAGHRNVAQTACPGGVFYATLPALRTAVAARISAARGVGVDITAPVVSAITPTTISPTMSRSLGFGIVFKEPVIDLTEADLAITGTSTGWSIASLTGSAAVYSVVLTADSPTPGTVGLTLAADSVVDLSENLGPSAPVDSGTSTWVDDLSGTVTRIAGSDRYTTAAAISAASFAPGVPVVYIATGTKYPDALAGAVPAAIAAGPVLLVSGSTIPHAVSTELTRLAPGRIVILGGTSVVPSSVQTALASYTSGTVTRIAGVDRYATAAAISATSFASGVPIAYVATGQKFPDALAGAVAATLGPGPMLLVPGETIPPVVAAELGRLNAARIVVLGGTSVVSTGVQTALAGYTAGTVTRIAGIDRYATAAAISAAHFDPGVSVVYIATGDNYPDALSGAVAAALGPGPVLLVAGGTIPPAVVTELKRLKPGRIVILGGVAVVSAGLQTKLASYLGP
ncbi:MAG: cell wall-binding repeat-containing protein [Chloroflexota bacterium]